MPSQTTDREVYRQLIEAKLHESLGDWHCVEGLESGLCPKPLRDELRQHYESLGYEVSYERRMNSGQKLRAFWIKGR